MTYKPVYTHYTTEMTSLVLSLIGTLRSETIPINGHTDPGAVEDCWNSVSEIINCMVKKIIEPDQPKHLVKELVRLLPKYLTKIIRVQSLF